MNKLAVIVAVLVACTRAAYGDDPLAKADLRMKPVTVDGYLEQPLLYNQVRPQGLLMDRIQFSLDKLVHHRDGLCHYIDWGADQVARWVGATSVLAALTGADLQRDIQPKLKMALAAQDAEGLFFSDEIRKEMKGPDPKGAQLRGGFGQGRAIWNFQEYYRIFGDEHVLQAVLKAADWAVAVQDPDEVSNRMKGSFGCSVESSLGAMVVLGQQTRNDKYIQYARCIADRYNTAVGRPCEHNGFLPTPGRSGYGPIQTERGLEIVKETHGPGAHHTHSYFALAKGVVDLAIATGEKKYLDQARKAFDDSLPSVWCTGGIPEHFGGFWECGDEPGCSIMDWGGLCFRLYRATGEVRYLDAVELAILNQFLAAQGQDGSTYGARTLNRRTTGYDKNRGINGDICCTQATGWFLGQIAVQTITSNQDGFSVNLPLDVDVTTSRHGNTVRINQTIFINPHALRQQLYVYNGDTVPFALKIRIPYWSSVPSLSVDRNEQELEVTDSFTRVSCPPDSRLMVSLKLPMKLQVIPPGRSILTKDCQAPEGIAPQKALQYGPFILMFNRQMYPEVTDYDLSVTIPLDQEGRPFVEQALPGSWDIRGAVPILVRAKLKDGTDLYLTPVANLTMTRLTVDDPLVVRFASIQTE